MEILRNMMVCSASRSQGSAMDELEYHKDVLVSLLDNVKSNSSNSEYSESAAASRRRDGLIFRVTWELLERKGHIDDRLYEEAVEGLSLDCDVTSTTVIKEKTLVELCAVVGYYSMVALTLNTFRVAP